MTAWRMVRSEDKEIGVKADSITSKTKIILDVSHTEITINYAFIYPLRSTTNIKSMVHPNSENNVNWS